MLSKDRSWGAVTPLVPDAPLAMHVVDFNASSASSRLRVVPLLAMPLLRPDGEHSVDIIGDSVAIDGSPLSSPHSTS